MVSDGIKCHVFGNMKQGRYWAEWASRRNISQKDLADSLDHTLQFCDFESLNPENLSKMQKILKRETYDKIIAYMEEKSSNGKTNDGSEDKAEEEELEAEHISNISIADVGISLFDAQFKEEAIEYKAMLHASRMEMSSLAFSIKATKSIWAEKEGQYAWKSLTANSYANELDDPVYGKTYSRSLSRRLAMSSERTKSLAPKKNLDPLTARDADLDRLVLEGEPSINMGRGVPDPTPFGNNRIARRATTIISRDAIPSGRRSVRRASRIDSYDNNAAERPPNKIRTGKRVDRRIGASSFVGGNSASEISFVSEMARKPMRRSEIGAKPRISRMAETAGRGLPLRETISQPRKTTRREVGPTPRMDKRTMAKRSVSWMDKLSERMYSASPPKIEYAKEINEPRTRRKFSGASDGVTGRMRSVSISKTTPMRSLFGIVSPRGDDDPRATRKNLSSYSQSERSLLLGAAQRAMENLTGQWRARLGLGKDDQINEDAMLGYIDKQSEGNRNVYPLQIQAHNLMILDELLHDVETSPDKNRDGAWWNIKDTLMESIISDSGILPATARKEGDSLSAPPAKPQKTPYTPKQQQTSQQTLPSASQWSMDDETKARILSGIEEFEKSRYSGRTPTPVNRFGESERRWDEHSPAEQTAIKNQFQRRLDELIANVNMIASKGGVAANPKEGRGDYLEDGVLTPSGVAKMLEDGWTAVGAPGGANFYEDVASLIAIMDMMDKDVWDPRMKNDAWLRISNRNRSVITGPDRADVQSREQVGIRDPYARMRGKPGERTVVFGSGERRNIPEAKEQGDEKAQTENTETTASDRVSTSDVAADQKPKAKTVKPVINLQNSAISSIVKTVEYVDENGQKIVAEVSSFGDKDQYDYNNQYLDKDGRLYLFEGRTKLYRDPITKEYLEEYSDPDNPVPVNIDAELAQDADLEPVNKKKSEGQKIVSYPQVTVNTADPNSKQGGKNYYELSNLRADGYSHSGTKITKLEVFANAMGITADEAARRLGIPAGGKGKVVYLAPGVNQASVDNWREAYNVMLSLEEDDLSQETKKEEMVTIDIVRVRPNEDGSLPTAAEAYAEYIGIGKDALLSQDATDLSDALRQMARRGESPSQKNTDTPRTPGMIFGGLVYEKQQFMGGRDETITYEQDGSEASVHVATNIVNEIPKYLPPHVNKENSSPQFTIFDFNHPTVKADGTHSYYSIRNRNLTVLVPGVGNLGDERLKHPFMIVVRYHPGFSGTSYGYGRHSHSMSNLAEKINRAMVTDDSIAWYEAFKEATRQYNVLVEEHASNLAEWRKSEGARSRTKLPKRNFIRSGEQKEQLAQVIAEIINPNLGRVYERIRNNKSANARRQNSLSKALKQRVFGETKNTPGIEERLTTLEVDSVGNVTTRDTLLIEKTSEMNMTEGFLPHVPMNAKQGDEEGIALLSENQISMLAQIRLAEEEMFDPNSGDSDLQNSLFQIGTANLSRQYGNQGGFAQSVQSTSRKKMGHLVALENSGFHYKPVQVTPSEMNDLLLRHDDSKNDVQVINGVDAREDTPTTAAHWLPIVRGIASPIDIDRILDSFPQNLRDHAQKVVKWFFGEESKNTSEAASELIAGEYFVPSGLNGAAGGEGLNFYMLGAGGHGGYTGGSNDKVLMAINSKARVSNRGFMALLSQNLAILVDMINSAIYSDSGYERESFIDEENWNEENYEFDRPKMYGAHYAPLYGATSGVVEGDILDVSQTVSIEYQANRGRQAQGAFESIGPSMESRLTNSEGKYELFSRIWKNLFGENPPEEFQSIDSSDEAKLKKLSEEIIRNLEVKTPEKARELREDSSSAALRNRGMRYTESALDPRFFDVSHIADVAAQAGAGYFTPEEMRKNMADEWFRRTRAQVVSWYIQLEILKGQAIAKARAAGEVPWNEEIRKYIRGQEILMRLQNDEVLMGIVYGIDAYTSSEYTNQFQMMGMHKVGEYNATEAEQVAFSMIGETPMFYLYHNEGKQASQTILLNRTATVAVSSPMTVSQIAQYLMDLGIGNVNPYASNYPTRLKPVYRNR